MCPFQLGGFACKVRPPVGTLQLKFFLLMFWFISCIVLINILLANNHCFLFSALSRLFPFLFFSRFLVLPFRTFFGIIPLPEFPGVKFICRHGRGCGNLFFFLPSFPLHFLVFTLLTAKGDAPPRIGKHRGVLICFVFLPSSPCSLLTPDVAYFYL